MTIPCALLLIACSALAGALAAFWPREGLRDFLWCHLHAYGACLVAGALIQASLTTACAMSGEVDAAALSAGGMLMLLLMISFLPLLLEDGGGWGGGDDEDLPPDGPVDWDAQDHIRRAWERERDIQPA